MNDLDVLIIGGGIGGMTTALALQQRGCRVSVFEQSTEFAEVGAGLTLASNAMHVMWHLGLKEPMGQFSTLPDHGAIKHYRTGKHLVDIAISNRLLPPRELSSSLHKVCFFLRLRAGMLRI